MTEAKVKTVDELTQTMGDESPSPDRNDVNDSLIPPSDVTDPAKNQAFFNLVKSIQNRFSSTDVGWPTAFFIMISMSYGAAVLILPFTVQQLGIVIWLLFTVTCFLILSFCGVLLKEACCKHLANNENISKALIQKQPYPTVAELAVGKRFSKFLLGTLYICLASEVLAFMLLAATTMNNVVVLYLPYYARIRIWLIIAYVVAIPFFMQRTISDLTSPALIAVTTSIISTVCIIVVSIVAKMHYGVTTLKYETKSTGSHPHMFKVFGQLMFAASGPALLIPNILVMMKKPQTFHIPIIWSHSIVLCIYALISLVPYFVFGQRVEGSIIDTLNETIVKFHMSPYWISVVTIAEVVLAIHFVMVAVLSANPVFLSLEHVFNVQAGNSIKRFLLRMSLIVFALVCGLIVPFFQPVISIIGAVLLVLLCVIYPIIIYWNTFKISVKMKVFLSLILIMTAIFMVGNVVFSIYDLVQYLKLYSSLPITN